MASQLLIRNVMKTRILFILSIFVFLGLGCKGSSSSPPSVPAPQGPEEPSVVPPEWKQLHGTKACEAMNPNSCQGYYGFTIRSDGSFETGMDNGAPKKF